MPSTPLRPHAYTPSPQSAHVGVMPDLYRLSVGPVGSTYYQKHFLRFETLGKAVPSWNYAAAFFTLSWLILRKLWRPAGIYTAVLAGVLALWWWGLHGRVPLAMEASISLLLVLLLCAVPGFIGTGLYYHHVREQTLNTLNRAPSLAQARVHLAAQAITPERLQIVASVHALITLLIGAALLYAPALHTPEEPATHTVLTDTGPQLFIPTIESPQTQEAQTPIIEHGISPETLHSAPLPTPEEPSSLASALPEAEPLTPDLTQATAPPVLATPLSSGPASYEEAPDVVSPKPTASTPAPKVPPPIAIPPAAASHLVSGKYYLNAGVYADIRNVEAAEQRLHKLELHTVRQTINGKNRVLTRLYIGPFEQRKQAQQAAARVQALQLEAVLLRAP